MTEILDIDPGAILMDWLMESVASSATGSLAAGIAKTDLTFSVGAGEGTSFPKKRSFVVKIDSELVKVTRSTDTFTVDGRRGAFGTTAASHVLGATVSLANFSVIVGQNVWSPQADDDFENKEPAVVFWIRGGDVRIRSSTVSPSFQVECFGGSDDPIDAMAVYRALRGRLQGRTGEDTDHGELLSATEEGHGQELIDPVTAWRKVLTYYTVHSGPLDG